LVPSALRIVTSTDASGDGRAPETAPGGRILSAMLMLREERRRLGERLARPLPPFGNVPAAPARDELRARLACVEGSLAEAEACLLEALERGRTDRSFP
jgi:hypothetical protein